MFCVLTVYFPAHVAGLLVDLLIFGLVFRLHVPVKAVLESGGLVVVILNLFELGLIAANGPCRLDKMCLGLGDQPVGQSLGNVLVLLNR